MADTEGGRMAQVEAAARCCAARQALDRARARGRDYGRAGLSCRSPCELVGGTTMQATWKPPVQLESLLLEDKIKKCGITYSTDANGNKFGVPVSPQTRIADIQQCAVDTYFKDRLAAFRRPYFPPVCPPIPQEALNANVPKVPPFCDNQARALGLYRSATA